jgi:hypothetical protein
VDWRLVTNLTVRYAEQEIEKLSWYALRWKIEVFHKIMKSGCRAQEVKRHTAERLANLLAVFCILSWRVFWVSISSRAAPEPPPELALTSYPTRGQIRDHREAWRSTPTKSPGSAAISTARATRRPATSPWLTGLTDIGLGLRPPNLWVISKASPGAYAEDRHGH